MSKVVALKARINLPRRALKSPYFAEETRDDHRMVDKSLA